MHVMRMMLWRLASVFAVLLAVIGIALPGLPTVPFLILAAWCAGKGWPRLEQWLLTHPTFGPPIRQWRAHGVVPRKAKYIASVMIMISMCLLWLSAAPHLVAASITLFVGVVLVWLWRRPEQALHSTLNTQRHSDDKPIR